MKTEDDDKTSSYDGYNTSESSATGWFVGIILALALAAIAYLVFTAGVPDPTANLIQ